MSLKRRSRSILRRRDRLPMLSTALFGPKSIGYARRRLLFPTIRTAMMAFFHALEAAALLLIFDPRFLIPIISLRLATSLASGAIWGATEAFRQDVRAIGPKNQESLCRRIEEALARASLFAIVLVGASVFYVWRFPQISRGFFSVIDAYVLALAFRVALSWVSRTYHSGLLAKRRVYRPKWSLLIPDIFDGLGLFIFWRILGPWSIAVAVVGSSMLHGTLAYHYSRRGYLDSGVALPRIFRLARLRIPSVSLVKRWLLSVCIGLSCELPSVFVLGQWHSLAGGADITSAMLLYWARPFASFLSSIPRLYYVDLVGAGELGPVVSRRLRRGITKTILLLGALLTLSCTAFALLYATKEGALALLLYLAISTLLAIFTLRALLFMIFGYAPAKVEDRPPLAQFLESIRSSPLACQAVLMELETGQPARIAHALISAITQLEGASACRLGRRYLVAVSTSPHGEDQWLRVCAGTAKLCAVGAWSSRGQLALRSLYDSKQFPRALKNSLSGPSTGDALQSLVMTRAPEALVMTASNRQRSRRKPGSMGDLRHAIRQYQGSFPPKAALWGEQENLLLLLEKGRADWLAIISADTPPEVAAELRRQSWGLGIRRAWLGSDALCHEANPSRLEDEKEA